MTDIEMLDCLIGLLTEEECIRLMRRLFMRKIEAPWLMEKLSRQKQLDSQPGPA